MCQETPPISSQARHAGSITKEEHAQGIEKLIEWGRAIEPHTIVLGFGEHGSMGTCVPVRYKSENVLLSASHVAKNFKKEKQVRLIFQPDRFTRDYPPKETAAFEVHEWDPDFRSEMLKDVLSSKPKDLAVIKLAPCIAYDIGLYRLFYQVFEKPDLFANLSLITMGCTEAKKENGIIIGNFAHFGVVSPSYHEFSDRDYIVCTVSTTSYEIQQLGRVPVSSFRGLSGGGLWAIINDEPHLLGIAIAEDLEGYTEKGEGTLFFHGPKSIIAALKAYIDKIENKKASIASNTTQNGVRALVKPLDP